MSAPQKQSAAAAEPDLPEVVPPNCGKKDELDDHLSPVEAEQLRKERLEAIRTAIGRGDYDLEEIFEKALSRMMRRLEDEDTPV